MSFQFILYVKVAMNLNYIFVCLCSYLCKYSYYQAQFIRKSWDKNFLYLKNFPDNVERFICIVFWLYKPHFLKYAPIFKKTFNTARHSRKLFINNSYLSICPCSNSYKYSNTPLLNIHIQLSRKFMYNDFFFLKTLTKGVEQFVGSLLLLLLYVQIYFHAFLPCTL